MSQSGSITEKWLRIEQLRQGKYQPRKLFNKPYLINLAESIKQDGVLEPLIVRSAENDNLYEIVAGECRWRAAQIAGLSSVPCRIGVYTDEQACRIALVENTARANLNPIEKAEGMARLIEEFAYTHLQVSQTLGMPRSEVSNTLRLLKLEFPVKEMISAGVLTEAHGKILASVKNIAQQCFLASECVNKQWSTRALDNTIKNSQKSQSNNSKNTSLKKDTNTVKLEQNLSDFFGYETKISLGKDNVGDLNIHFYNLDGLQSILEKVGFSKANEKECIDEY